MDHRPSVSLTKDQVSLGRKLNLYFLLTPIVAQHSIDGGIMIPSGRMIMLLHPDFEGSDYIYRCTEMLVAAPNMYDPQQKLPEGMLRMSASEESPLQFFVCPQGKELEWLRAAAERSHIKHPCLK